MRAVAFTPDGSAVTAAGNESHIRFWKCADRQPMLSRDPQMRRIRSLIFSADGGTVVSRDDNRHHKAILAVAFAPDGTTMVSGGSDATIRLWKAPN